MTDTRLVILDRDYLTCPESQIRDINPIAVVIDGKLVHGDMNVK